MPASWIASKTREGVRELEYGNGSFPTAVSRFHASRCEPEMFISEMGSASFPPRIAKPCTPREKSPVVSFEFPPRKRVTRMPSLISAMSASLDLSPSFQARFDVLIVVGAILSFLP